MRTLHSSWNSDRVGSCIAERPQKARKPYRQYLYTKYYRNEVSVCGARGNKLFTLRFDSDIESGVVIDGVLRVVVEGRLYKYNAATGIMIPDFTPSSPSAEFGRRAA